MGVLPCQLPEGVSAQTLGLDGTETFDLLGVGGKLCAAAAGAASSSAAATGGRTRCPVTVRIETPIEAEYHRHGGIMQYVLRQNPRPRRLSGALAPGSGTGWDGGALAGGPSPSYEAGS